MWVARQEIKEFKKLLGVCPRPHFHSPLMRQNGDNRNTAGPSEHMDPCVYTVPSGLFKNNLFQNGRISKSMYEWTDGWMDQWINGSTQQVNRFDGCINRWTHHQINGSTDGQINRWMDQQMDGSTDGQINRRKDQQIYGSMDQKINHGSTEVADTSG